MTRRIGRSCALALAVLSTAGAASAGAATSTTTFSATGAEQTFTVPAGVTQLSVVATGGHGGVAADGGVGVPGRAATITGTLAVVPGEVLYVEVGANGVTGCSIAFNGGGLVDCGSNWSGGGGGASDIRTVPSAHGELSLLSRLLVAGGGGGAGYGANGGDAGLDGAGQAGATNGGQGGGGATHSAGGSGGTVGAGCTYGTDGGAGSLGSGGAVGDYHSGSGGGGYYGGGGGGGWTVLCAGPAAGGGGGGSSYIAPGVDGTIAQAALTDAPTVAITVATPEAQADATSLTFATQTVGSVSAPQTVRISNPGDAPLHVSGLTFTGANADDFLLGSDDCRGAIPVGGSCTAQVRFAPLAAGARSATLAIASDASGGTIDVSLSGDGAVAPAAPQGPTGAQGPAGPQGRAGADGRSIDALRCTRLAGVHGGLRTFRCRLLATTLPPAGTSARFTRGGKTIARGTVDGHGRVVLRSRSAWLNRGGTLAFGNGLTVVVLG